MELREWFLMDHAHVHGKVVSLCEGLSEEQLRCAPGEKFNSIVWLQWHMARCEDVMVNTVLRNVVEVLDEGEWLMRLGVTVRHIGTDDSHDEVESFSRRVNVAALRAYSAAVAEETQRWAAEFSFYGLNEAVTAADVQRADQLGAFGPRAAWVAALWPTRTRGFLLSWLAIGHNYQHTGEGWVIRSLIE